MERDKNKKESTKEFVEKYWPALVAGATIVGATVWLVARYIKEKKSKDSQVYKSLSQLETEAMDVTDETSIILETGSELSRVAGPDIEDATRDLSKHLTNEKAKSTLGVLNGLAEIEKNKTKRGKSKS